MIIHHTFIRVFDSSVGGYYQRLIMLFIPSLAKGVLIPPSTLETHF